MSQSLNIKISGLYSFPSDLSAVPPGALTEATNIILDQDSIAAPRRGFDYLAHGSYVQSQFSDASYRANKLFYYQGQTIAHYGNNLLAYHNPTSGWTNYSGTYAPPSNAPTCNTTSGSATVTNLSSISGLAVGQAVYGPGIPAGTYIQSVTTTTATLTKQATATATGVTLTFVVAKVRSAQANQNFYFTTSTGVKKLDKYTNTPVAIGVPPGLDTNTAITTTVTPTATTTNTSNVLTALSSTSGLAIGMSATGTGLPANTLVTSFTSTTVTLSNAATANGTVTITFAAPATFLAASTTTSYRVVWGYTDANANLELGAPSSSSQITNTIASAVAVNVTFTIPAAITTAYFYQIYRVSSVAAGNNPGDEQQLVYQGNPLAADLTAGFITVCDIVPDSLKGAYLYTNQQTGVGLANENYTVPLALDLAVFRNCLFFANTSTLQSYNLTLLGVGTPNGIQVGDTLKIGGVVYTAASSENTATGNFLVTNAFLLVTTGTTASSTSLTSLGSTTGVTVGMAVSGTGIPAGTYVTAINSSSSVTINQAATASASGVAITFTGDSAAQAIRDTALSLIRVINRYASSTVYAYYTSISTGLPGMLSLTGRTVGTAAFNVVSSRSTCWSPALASSVPATTVQTSTNSINKNFLYFSLPSQPEAVPVGNYIPVGSADKNILRILALRDSLFIIKEDGTFFLSGTDPTNFVVTPLDYTSILIAPESAVVLNNQIFALTTQGVVAINTIGAPIQSHPIEGSLTALVAQNYSLLQTSSFGVAYESSRAYYLFCPTFSTDTGPTQYFRFNYITNSWTHGTLAKTCGGVNPVDDHLYLGNNSLNIVDVERKSLTYSDYADYQSTQTISAVSGTTITISGSDTIAVGSVIYQSANVFGTVVATNPVLGTVTTSLTTGLVAGSADILAPIACTMSWAPITFSNPGYSKQIREATLLFLSDFNGVGSVGFSSDVSPGVIAESITGGAVGGWGLFAWGGPSDTTPTGSLDLLGVAWSGDPRRRPVRVSVTRDQQRCSILTISWNHAYAYSPWKLQGVSLIGNLVSERSSN